MNWGFQVEKAFSFSGQGFFENHIPTRVLPYFSTNDYPATGYNFGFFAMFVQPDPLRNLRDLQAVGGRTGFEYHLVLQPG